MSIDNSLCLTEKDNCIIEAVMNEQELNSLLALPVRLPLTPALSP
ncbi:hypothetical protein [Bradyrhizobium sp. USDA 4353]